MHFNPSINPVNKPFVPIHWQGSSGTIYEFQIDPIGVLYKPVGGVYIFCRDLGRGSFSAIYVGETDNFNRRLSNDLRSHHALETIRAHGATHISTLRVAGNLANRLRIETDLRQSLNTPCNKQ